jgi:hydrogenase expression/formation protein HypC
VGSPWGRRCWRTALFKRDRRQRRMCLGIPGQIVEILDEDIYLAKAEVGGVRRNINIGLVHHDEQRIEIGDWVLIHVGFAMSKLDEEEAHLALRALEQIGEEYEQELEELKASRIE